MRRQHLSAILALILALSLPFSSFASEIVDETEVTKIEESSDETVSTEEITLTEESTSTEESPSTEETTSTEENTSTEEITSTEEGASTEENTSTKGAASAEESVSAEESSSPEVSIEEAGDEDADDESITNEASEESWETAEHVHTYSASWFWSDDYAFAEVTLTCSDEDCAGDTDGHTVSLGADEGVVITSETAEAVTNENGEVTEAGYITYTASVEYENIIYTDEQVVIAAYGGETEETDCEAGTYETVTDGGIAVSLEWDEGAFTGNPEIVIEDVDKETALAHVEEALDGEDVTITAAYGVDITFYVDGEEAEPSSAVRVRLKLPAEAVSETDNVYVVHKHDDEDAVVLEESAGNVEALDVAIDEDAETIAVDMFLDEFSETDVGIETTSTDSSITDFASLVTKLNEIQSSESKTGTIELSSDISITGNLTITGDITLTTSSDSSTKKTLSLAGDYTITVESGATLTIKGAKIDGNTQDYNTSKVGFLIVKGTLNLGTNGYIKNFKNEVSNRGQSNSGIIYVDGGTFNMTGGYIYGNSFVQGDSIVNQHDAIVYITNGGTFDMSGGYIGYSTSYYNDLGLATIDSLYSYNAAVIVGCSDEEVTSTFNMTGGTIKMTYGGPAVLIGGLTTNTTSQQKFVMSGGTIGNNYGYSKQGKNSVRFYGGSVTILQGDFELCGGTISSNVYYKYGAGVSILSEGNVNFKMTDGTIKNNLATYSGGGIYVGGMSNYGDTTDVELSGGTISGNTASNNQGGGIYVVSGFTVRLYNAVIYGNTAKRIGGGIWTCSTGNLKVYVKSGGAIFDNTATATSASYSYAGDDLAFVIHSDESEFILADTALGGGKVAYYRDGGIRAGTLSTEYYGSTTYWIFFLGDADGSDRYDSSNPGEAVTTIDVTTSGIALKSVMTDDAKEAAKASAKLVITGNTSYRGGAIGANGSVIIGEETTTFEVTKEWLDGDDESSRPDSITVNLYNTASNTVVRTATLSADNDWTYTFTGLSYGDNYSYYVKEVEVEGYTSSAGEVTGDYTTGYKQTITNTRSGGGELVDVTITWDDLNDAEGIRPDSVTIVLYSNGEVLKTVTVSASDDWFGTTDLLGGVYPAYDEEGNAITYSFSVIQNGVDQYTTTYLDAEFSTTSEGLKLTSLFVHNVYRPKVSVEVSKVWNDDHNADGLRPDSLTATLYADGEVTDQTLTLTADNDWSGTFKDLDKYNEDATLIDYAVIEGEVDGYEQTSSEVTFDEDAGTYVITLTNSPSEDSSFTTTTTTTTTTTSSSSSGSSSSSSASTSTAEEAGEVLEAEREPEVIEAKAEEAGEVLGLERGAGTGDTSNLLLWILLLIAEGAGLGAAVIYFRFIPKSRRRF